MMSILNMAPGRLGLAQTAAALLLSGYAGAALPHTHMSPENPGQVAASRLAKPTLVFGATIDAQGRIWLARVENRTLLVSHLVVVGLLFFALVVVFVVFVFFGAVVV